MTGDTKPLGAVLAGGAGERLGGSKPATELAGRPLIAYPLDAFARAGIDAVVVAKPDSELPPLTVEVLREPAEPRHPLLGIVTALAHAGGGPVVVAPCDTPFIDADLLARLAGTTGTTVAYDGARLHPLIARYEPEDSAALERAVAAGRSATDAAGGLSPALLAVGELQAFNVNSAADIAVARQRMSMGR